MARVKFGNTWWGQQWLNSFNQVYESNRLARGQTYARNGAVISISLSAGLITAKVQGSRSTPYAIQIALPLFKDNQKNMIMDIIGQNPYHLSQLLSAKLPPIINEELLKHKVQIFPQKWNDFKAKCSCPDQANPCKHLAAVIYQVTNLVDQNPFTLFELKGFDLLSAINKLHNNNLTIENKIPHYTKLTNDNLLLPNTATNEIDFTKLNIKTNLVFGLIKHNPRDIIHLHFYSQLKSIYTDLAQYSEILIRRQVENNDTLKNLNAFEIKAIQINPDLSSKILIYNHNKTKKITTLDDLISFIQHASTLESTKNSPQINSLCLVFQLTTSLLINGAFIPQFYQSDNDEYMIRYIPLLQDELVNELFISVASQIPSDLVMYPTNLHQLSKFDQCLWLIALFIKHLTTHSIIYYCIQHKLKNKTNQSTTNIILDMIDKLVISAPIKIKQSKDMVHFNELNSCLKHFYAINDTLIPVIQINDANNIFSLDLLFEDKRSQALLPLNTILSDNKYMMNDILGSINLISEYIPQVANIFSNNQRPSYSEEDFIPLLFNILPMIKIIGVRILLPKALHSVLIPKKSIKVNKISNSNESNYLQLEDILSFDWQISLGDTDISVTEFQKLLNNGHKLVKIKEQYVYLDNKNIENILLAISKPIKNSTQAELLRDLIIEDFDNNPLILSKEIKDLINKLLVDKPVTKPDGLLAQLRDYQYAGYRWLYKNLKLGFGCIIADDMGLGKTIQVISCILKLKQDKSIRQSLIIVPTSLLTNWTKEIERFAPSLSVHIQHGSKREQILPTQDIVLITYGTIKRDIELINSISWDLLVIDEAQNIKNVASQQTKLIKSIKAKHRIAMSGTPVENRLIEYYSIMDFANKGYLGSVRQFNQQFANPIQNYRDPTQLNKFLLATKPFVLRRLKSDKSIISDLPDKVVINEYCNLSKQQVALYKATVDNIMKKLQLETEQFARSSLVLTLITALKQICNHPMQYLKQLDNLDVDSSGKMVLLIDKLKDIYPTSEKVLIFTQFKEMGTILQKTIENECDTPVLFLHGGVTRNKRDEMVNLIQNSPQHQTMILSIKAGGVGLNLTGANHVIHYDLWWNPAVENQATDRAYRIGQNKNVFVHRFICSNSFEEKINQMIKDKEELANLTITTGEKWIGNLSDKELHNIFNLT